MKKEMQELNALPFLRETKEGLEIHLHVQPRASKNEISGIHGSYLKLRIKAPPVDGEANKACQKFLAKLFKIPASSVTMISGASSREKRFLIKGAKLSRIAKACFSQVVKK